MQLALDAAKAIETESFGVRVVSMPSQELFELQSKDYKEAVLPKDVRHRVAMEAGATMSWYRYVGLDGMALGIDTFGASGNAKDVFKTFGLTTEGVTASVKEYLNRR